MDSCMKHGFRIIKIMEKGDSSAIIKIPLLDISRKERESVKDWIYLEMEQRDKGHSRMDKKKVSIFILSQMASKKNKYGKMETWLGKRRLNDI